MLTTVTPIPVTILPFTHGDAWSPTIPDFEATRAYWNDRMVRLAASLDPAARHERRRALLPILATLSRIRALNASLTDFNAAEAERYRPPSTPRPGGRSQPAQGEVRGGLAFRRDSVNVRRQPSGAVTRLGVFACEFCGAEVEAPFGLWQAGRYSSCGSTTCRRAARTARRDRTT